MSNGRAPAAGGCCRGIFILGFPGGGRKMVVGGIPLDALEGEKGRV